MQWRLVDLREVLDAVQLKPRNIGFILTYGLKAYKTGPYIMQTKAILKPINLGLIANLSKKAYNYRP